MGEVRRPSIDICFDGNSPKPATTDVPGDRHCLRRPRCSARDVVGSHDQRLDLKLPEAAIVVPFAPQLDLLRRAALTITHAGLNTALESLTQGVPMVAIPITNDQPGVASRLEWLGVARVVPPARLTAQRLRASVRLFSANRTITPGRSNGKRKSATLKASDSLPILWNVPSRRGNRSGARKAVASHRFRR